MRHDLPPSPHVYDQSLEREVFGPLALNRVHAVSVVENVNAPPILSVVQIRNLILSLVFVDRVVKAQLVQRKAYKIDIDTLPFEGQGNEDAGGLEFA